MINETISRGALLCGIAAGVLLAGTAHAEAEDAEGQQADGSAPAANDSVSADDELGVIMVTAQRREENLQRTPVSVTALTPDDLARRAVVDPAALQGLLPAVQFQSYGELRAIIRGVGTFTLQPGVDSAVAYNVDSTYLANPVALPPLLFDIARIEVLRGPQGTLFGRNSNGGALNIITRRPEYDFGGEVTAQIGNYDLFGAEGAINVPLGDSAALRTSFAAQQHDPYMKDGHFDADMYAGRARLLVEPSSNLEILLTTEYSQQRNAGVGFTPCPPRSTNVGCANTEWDPYAGFAPLETQHFYNVDNFTTYGEVNLDLGFADLISLTSWRDVDQIYHGGVDPASTFDYLTEIEDQQFTQELRLSSNPGSWLTWTIGAFYSRQTLDYTNTFSPYVSQSVIISIDDYVSTSKAIFAQATAPITDRFRITGGIRYTDERKESVGSAAAFSAGLGDYVVTPTGATLTDDPITWRAGVEFDAADDTMLYASVNTGRKSGGLNQVQPGIGLPTTYAPESITAYQAGIKSRFLDNRVQLNAEVFHYDYSNFHALGALFDPTGTYPSIYFLTLNSQEARFFGGEVEANILLGSDTRLNLNATVLDTKHEVFEVEVGGNSVLSYSGNRAANAPEFTFGASLSHDIPLGNGGEIRLQAESVLTGPQFLSFENYPSSYQGAYTQSSANVGYVFPNGRYSVTAWIRNIEDKGAMLHYIAATGALRDKGVPLQPRTFGLTLRAEFD